VILADNFGFNAVWTKGDFDTDGQVTFPDFVILADNFGKSVAAAAAVPEPTALIMAIVAIVVLRSRLRCVG
jgi:hypothetical protein